MQQSTISLIVAGVALIGTLGGVLAGRYLTRSWEREKWLLDSEKEEYKELMSTISASYGTIMQASEPGYTRSANDKQAIREAQLNVLRMLRDRVFVAGSLSLDELFGLWNEGF